VGVTVSEFVEHLAATGVEVGLGDDGRLRLRGPAAAVEEAVAVLRTDARLATRIHWGVRGAETGHAWRACSVCGQEQLVYGNWRRRCGLTPRCDGVLLQPAPLPRLVLLPPVQGAQG
jgi:hypothetical protein